MTNRSAKGKTPPIPVWHRNGPVVHCEGLSKTYRSGRRLVCVLEQIDLEIARGECVAIMGPSGCGKTTLVNCLSGLDRPDKGSVSFEGTQLTRANDRIRTRLRAQRMGFVFQSFNLVPVLPILANVRLPLELAGIPRPKAENRARDALVAVGLEGFEQRRPPELSGGEQQRVAIARALVNGPAVVWADEPTGNLDRKTGDHILGLFNNLNKTLETTFVIVTHDPAVASIAGRTIRLDSGKIAEDGAS